MQKAESYHYKIINEQINNCTVQISLANKVTPNPLQFLRSQPMTLFERDFEKIF